MESLVQGLKEIQVSPPDIVLRKSSSQLKKFPENYQSNTEKEEYMLSCCENFRRQYKHLYRDRKPLFLTPKNECGIEKFICTTLRPTQLKFPDLNQYSGCAEFVADYLNFEALDPPIDLPLTLVSPTTVLDRQQGNSFDYCNFLCSLLIGAGYDAYCVSGYATREVCLMDETREKCPFFNATDKVAEQIDKKKENKYTVKPPKDLRSKFELKMEEKMRKEEEDREKKLLEEESQRIAELEKPPEDKLYGLRIHCWILILAGKREVPEAFFLEALTGQPKSLEFTGYLGIESIWNHRNVWLNMQDCSYGVKNLTYDLGNAEKWEFMFPSTDKPLVVIPDVNKDLLEIEDDDENIDEVTVDIPPSWVQKIEVSEKDFETRCPQGKKTIFYKKAKLEKFCDYLNKDGLVTRISVASDNDLKKIIEVIEIFKHRADKLERKVHNLLTGWITEYFAPGRPQSLKEHSYKASSPRAESDRKMVFYSSARIDGLSTREETPKDLSETFVGREDLLCYRHATFKDRVKKFGPQGNNNRPIAKMVERFNRDSSKAADDDISERSFMVAEDRINIKFHLEKGRIIASTREFIKPPNISLDKTSQLQFTPDMTSAFDADVNAKPVKELKIYQMMVDLLHAEKKCTERIRDSEEEVREIIDDRTKEESNTELFVSVYDTGRNEKAKLRREELDRQQKEDELRKREMELDYLAPFLARIGNPEKLTRGDASKVREECLGDLKQRLIDKANLIQARFEKETGELQKKQTWYQENQMNLTKEDEEDYLNFCSEAMFRIHILELRLNRHKEMAPHRYMQLDEKLRKDTRLSDIYF